MVQKWRQWDSLKGRLKTGGFTDGVQSKWTDPRPLLQPLHLVVAPLEKDTRDSRIHSEGGGEARQFIHKQGME